MKELKLPLSASKGFKAIMEKVYPSSKPEQALILDEPASSIGGIRPKAYTRMADGTDSTLAAEHSFCWITVDSLSVKIQRFDDGICLEVYRCNEDIALENPVNLMRHSFPQKTD